MAALSRSLTTLVSLGWFVTSACGASSTNADNSGGSGAGGTATGGTAATRSGGSSAGGAAVAGATMGGQPSAGQSGSSASGGLSSNGGVSSTGGAERAGQGNTVGEAGAAGGAAQGGAVQGGAAGSSTGGAAAGGAGQGGDGEERCPSAEPPDTLSEVDVPGLFEASGLAASRGSPGVFYTHNDSGTSSDVYAFATDGSLIATLDLPGALTEDWEDIGVGPGPESGKSYLYIADIGDNASIRTTSILIQRALEPELSADERDRELALSFESLFFSYPDAPHNAETLLVDPRSGDLYIVTKGDPEGSRVYVAPAPHSTTSITPLTYLTTLAFGTAPLTGSPLATGGSVAPDGSAVLIRTYDAAFLWRRPPSVSLGEALLGEPCPLPVADEQQGEGITFGSDRYSYYTIGEGAEPALSRALLSY